MLSNHYNIKAKICTKTNTGTDFKPVYTWKVTKTINGRKVLLSEREIIRNSGGNILADYKLFIDPVTITNENVIVIDSTAYQPYTIDDIDEMGHHLEIKMLKLQPNFYAGMGI